MFWVDILVTIAALVLWWRMKRQKFREEIRSEIQLYLVGGARGDFQELEEHSDYSTPLRQSEDCPSEPAYSSVRPELSQK